MEETYITLEEASQRLGWSYNTIKLYCSNGIIPKEDTKRVGKRRMIAESYVKDMEGRAVLKAHYPRG